MFKAIETASQLPEIDIANELATLDFKVKVNPDDRLELAKDVAAFANGQGGTILIGAATRGEFVTKYLPHSKEDASATQRAYEESVRDRCRPAPIFTVAQIDRDGGKIVAVNIWPSVGQPVGVELKQSDLAKQLQGVFFYPARVGAHTRAILPEQMHMFVDAKFRRTALALGESVGSRVKLLGREISADWWGRGSVVSVDASANTVELLVEPDQKRITLPLDIIESVWRDGSGWKIRIPGCIRPVQWLPNVSDEYKVEELVFMEIGPGARTHDREQRIRVTNFPRPPGSFIEAVKSLGGRLRSWQGTRR